MKAASCCYITTRLRVCCGQPVVAGEAMHDGKDANDESDEELRDEESDEELRDKGSPAVAT